MSVDENIELLRVGDAKLATHRVRQLFRGVHLGLLQVFRDGHLGIIRRGKIELLERSSTGFSLVL